MYCLKNCTNPINLCNDSTDVGSFRFLRKLLIRPSRGAFPLVVMLRPRNSIFGIPNAHFDIESSRIFPDRSVECRQRVIQSLCKSKVCERPTVEVDCKELDSSLISHLEAVVHLRAVKLAEVLFASHMLCCFCYGRNGVIVLVLVVVEVVDSSQVD